MWGTISAVYTDAHKKARSELCEAEEANEAKEREVSNNVINRLNLPNVFTLRKKGLSFKKMPSPKTKQWKKFEIRQIKKLRKALGLRKRGLKKCPETLFAFTDLGGGRYQMGLTPKYLQLLRLRELDEEMGKYKSNEEFKHAANQMPKKTKVYVRHVKPPGPNEWGPEDEAMFGK